MILGGAACAVSRCASEACCWLIRFRPALDSVGSAGNSSALCKLLVLTPPLTLPDGPAPP